MMTMAATARTPSSDALAQAQPQPQPQLGLRERKKLKTRIAIRRATYRLIFEQGYEATTIEQIAEAAEVSPSTVFRYFPAKEDIVLTDEYDPVMEAELRARPADEPPIESLRALMHGALTVLLADDAEEMIQRSRLMSEVPAIRARMTEARSAAGSRLGAVLAERAGRDPEDLEVRVFTSAVLSALQEVTVYWAERGHQDDLPGLVDRALDALQSGLRL
jgi:AcrR family transcriptional regulator